MSELSLDKEVEKAAELLKSLLAMAASNFPNDTRVRLTVEGPTATAAIYIQEYVLAALVNDYGYRQAHPEEK